MTYRCEFASPTGWDDRLSELRGALGHTSIWAGYQQSLGEGKACYFSEGDGTGGSAAMALGMWRRPRHPILSPLYGELVLAAHPCARDEPESLPSAFLARIEASARAMGCARVVLGSFQSGRSRLRPEDHGYEASERCEFVADLTNDPEALWRAISKDQRERIRKLEREGVRVERAVTLEETRSFRSLRESTQTKRSSRGQGYALERTFDLYDAIHHHLIERGAARLYLARRNSETLAGLLFGTFGGRAYSLFSGSSPVGYKVGAQSAIYWKAVQDLRTEGYVELNRGGVPASAEHESDPLHGIYRFKLRLGTTVVRCRSGVKVVSPIRERIRRWRSRMGSAGTDRSHDEE